MIPPNRMILSALLGTGIQFLILTVVEVCLGVSGLYYGHKGTIKTTGLITYAFTGCKNSVIISLQWVLLGEVLQIPGG